jgi:hypothetical protein
MMSIHHDVSRNSLSDQEHVQLLLARLWAAEHALAAEIAEDLHISGGVAQVLARMRIDEVIDGPCEAADGDLVAGYPNESYCSKCWALVTPDTAQAECGDDDLFKTCVYCGQAAWSEDEWQEAA